MADRPSVDRETAFIAAAQAWSDEGRNLDALVCVRRYNHSGRRLTIIVDVADAWGHEYREFLLRHAARKRWVSAIKSLVGMGADVNVPLRDKETVLHVVARYSYDRHDAAMSLLDAGASVNVCTRLGMTPLHCVAISGNLEMCKLLLSRGASLELRNNEGRDAEAMARVCGHTTTVDLLAAVRAAGGWAGYVDAPRKELLALRRQLPSLRERGRAAPSSSVRLHERLFVALTDDDIFVHTVAFWRGPRDL